MGPILGVSFGAIIKDRRLLKNGFIGQFAGILIAIGIGIFLGFIASLTIDPLVVTAEMATRNFPNYFDFIIAICSGLAVGFCLTGGVAATLVGIAIAVALMPPAVNVGLALVYNDILLSVGSLTLLILNNIAINICAIIIFKLKKVTAPPDMILFWRGPIEHTITEKEPGLFRKFIRIFKKKKKRK